MNPKSPEAALLVPILPLGQSLVGKVRQLFHCSFSPGCLISRSATTKTVASVLTLWCGLGSAKLKYECCSVSAMLHTLPINGERSFLPLASATRLVSNLCRKGCDEHSSCWRALTQQSLGSSPFQRISPPIDQGGAGCATVGRFRSCFFTSPNPGSEKGIFWKRGLFRKSIV